MTTDKYTEYQTLNRLAEKNGVVILGGKEDEDLPLDELKQAFSLPAIYNRSVDDFCLQNALFYYDSIVKPLQPQCLLIHITERDKELFENNPDAFNTSFRNLIAYIRNQDKKCKIVIVSLKNFEGEKSVASFNAHVKDMCSCERCEYGDISRKRVWNPQATKDISRFLYDTGFVMPLKIQRPVYDLLKILYFYNGAA